MPKKLTKRGTVSHEIDTVIYSDAQVLLEGGLLNEQVQVKTWCSKCAPKLECAKQNASEKLDKIIEE